MSKEKQRQNWDRLKNDLGPQILSYLEDDNVIEIMVNDDGALWMEEHGQKMKKVGNINPSKIMMIINTVAYSLDTIVDQKNPILGGELPFEGSRFQALIPPVVIAPSFAIRKKAIKIYSLDDYLDSKTITKSQRETLAQLCIERKNILIVGSTGCGKTTFANAILKEISLLDQDCRVALIEDTRELQCDVQNKIVCRTSDFISMQDLLKAMMRFRPDRICVGEVRGAEAFALLMAWNTGHSGGIATVHANNARAGIQRIEQILMAHNFTPVPEIIAEAINVIVSIQKTDTGRKVKEIIGVSCHKKEYVFKEIL
jgi:type IV secretion system protein TrbB